MFQSIYPSRAKVCLQKALTDHEQVLKEEYGQSRHMASNYALEFWLISAQCFLGQPTSLRNHPSARLFQVVIQASHVRHQIFKTTMSFGKEFHNSAAHCIKKKYTCLSLLQTCTLFVSTNHPFFHCKSLRTVSSSAFEYIIPPIFTLFQNHVSSIWILCIHRSNFIHVLFALPFF